MSQLRKDLENRISDRLHKWIDDSGDLYEMAGLSNEDAIHDIMGQLVFAMIGAAVALDIPSEQLANLLRDGIEMKRKQMVDRE